MSWSISGALDLMIDFAILLSDSARARSYIQHLCNSGLIPSQVLLTPGQWTPPEYLVSKKEIGFDFLEPISVTIKKHRLHVINCETQDINAQDTIEKIKSVRGKFLIFGGVGGQILKKEVLSQGLPILHIHPGIVPYFRGSTTIYYSALTEKKAGASAFFFSEKIDEGSIILTREFDLIKGIDFDYIFDPEIRGLTLVDAVRILDKDMSTIKQNLEDRRLPYFIIHPVLKHIAMLNNTMNRSDYL
jgi:methionyl-tRNA formyltransferase